MITIGALSRVSETPAPPSPDEPEQARSDHGRRPLPLMLIPITISVGLLVAIGYVGIRIFAARPHPASSMQNAKTASQPSIAARPVASEEAQVEHASVVPVATAESAVTAVPQQPARTFPPPPPVDPVLAEDTSDTMIVPQPGERYLQIAAINTKFVPRFLSEMRRNDWQVRVAAGPSEGLVRVLVGPFSDHDSLTRAKAQLQAIAPDCFVRVY